MKNTVEMEWKVYNEIETERSLLKTKIIVAKENGIA